METSILNLSDLTTESLNLSDLTTESPLSLITEKLETRMDARHFRAVCHNLRLSIPEPPKTTIPRPVDFKIPVPFGYFSANISHYTLVESTVYAIQPLGKIPNPDETAATWFVRVEEPEFGPVKLKDTLSELEFENVAEELPISLNLLDYRVREIAKAYKLIPVVKDNPEADHTVGNQTRRIRTFEPIKVVVSDGFDVMVMHNKGGTLSVLRYGDKNWINLQDGNISEEACFDDIVYFDKKFYAINKRRFTLSYDCKTLAMKIITFSKEDFRSVELSLVKSDKELLMVSKWFVSFFLCSKDQFPHLHNFPVRFAVYKLGFLKWDELHEYEDRVFFLGNSCSFSLLTNEFPGCQKNSVYFSDEVLSPATDDDAHLFPRQGIFKKDDLSVRPLSDLPRRDQIFWPPPTWVQRNN